MSKPDDISQDIWDAARSATGGWMAAGNGESNHALIESVARAILAEREQCLAEIEAARASCEAERNKHPRKSELRIANHGAMTVCRDLAAIIRGGSNA